jgi:hypothetical protein
VTIDERNARDDYGRYKVACEDAVRAAHLVENIQSKTRLNKAP